MVRSRFLRFLRRPAKLSPRVLLVTVCISVLVLTNLLFLWDFLHHHGIADIASFRHEGIFQLVDHGEGIKVERNFRNLNSQKSQVEVLLKSGQQLASLSMDGDLIYSSSREEAERGLHLLVLSLESGRVMATRRFDTYSPGADLELVSFLEVLAAGRVVCLMLVDEASFHLGKEARRKLAEMGSEAVANIGWRDTWVFACKLEDGKYSKLAETHSRSVSHDSWGNEIEKMFLLDFVRGGSSCSWSEEEVSVAKRRNYFCSLYEGYGQLCDCKHALPIQFHPAALDMSSIDSVPVAVIASNRPRYLFRMLRTLLSARGSQQEMVTVYIDGHFEEVKDVCRLFGVRYKENEPISSKNARITQHYRTTLVHTFETHPSAEFAIILEEDLDIAPDFFSYFSQTMHLLKQDKSLYCISAWNDQGYEHSCQDASLLYRVESMPGLGWMLERRLFVEELEPQWPSPDKFWDWDMWMRTDYIRKGRECIIPDVSRTFHFGQSGLNMNPYFHDLYFKRHAINTDPSTRLENINQLTSERYDQLIHNLLDNARILDHTNHPCDEHFIPNTKGEVYVLYIAMKTSVDFDSWVQVAKCFKLWDLDARGFHKGVWRFWLKGNHILVVGSPVSPFAERHMPPDLTALLLTAPPT